MILEKVLKLIERYFPSDTAMENDRIGLQVQSGNDVVRKILITLELDDYVIEEASENNCDCIISFHPLIFLPLTEIHDTNRVGKLLQKLIRNNISLITIHTNFDSYKNGTSWLLSKNLGLKSLGFLVPDKKFDGYGMGVVAESEKTLSPDELLDKVQSVCHSPIKYTLGNTNKISKIAIVGGSGTSFIKDAIESGADAFITADATYHRFHEVKGKIMLIDPGHYEMEQFVPLGLLRFFKENIDKKEYDFILNSRSYTNPVQYYPAGNFADEHIKYLINYHNGVE